MKQLVFIYADIFLSASSSYNKARKKEDEEKKKKKKKEFFIFLFLFAVGCVVGRCPPFAAARCSHITSAGSLSNKS